MPSISKYRKRFGTGLAEEWTDFHEVFKNLVNSSISSENWISLYSKFSAQQSFVGKFSLWFSIHKKFFYWNAFVMSPGLLKSDTGGLANQAYLSNPIVSSKQ